MEWLLFAFICFFIASRFGRAKKRHELKKKYNVTATPLPNYRYAEATQDIKNINDNLKRIEEIFEVVKILKENKEKQDSILKEANEVLNDVTK